MLLLPIHFATRLQNIFPNFANGKDEKSPLQQ